MNKFKKMFNSIQNILLNKMNLLISNLKSNYFDFSGLSFLSYEFNSFKR